MGTPLLATREAVKTAMDSKLTARDNAQVDRALATATTAVAELLHWAHIYPVVATRYFDWPNDQYARSWELWLDNQGLISVTSVTSGGVALDPSTVLPSPINEGPPYWSIELNLGSASSFDAGSTHQRNIAITGLWGYRNDETTAGSLTGNLGTSGTAGIQLSPSVGIGSVLRIDDERIIVTDKTMVDTAQTLGGAGLTDRNLDTTVPVSDGTGFEVDEIILIDAERMLVVDIAGDNLVVRRAWDGTVLADHATSAPIYALAGFSVDRGQLGTTATSHTSGTTVYRWVPPALLSALAVAEAQCQILNEQSAYGRTVGSGDNEREAAGKTLAKLRDQACATHGRQARLGAI